MQALYAADDVGGRLREVIERPADLAGLDVSEVSAAILREARDEVGALPLVENALVALWSDPGRKGGPLRGEFYVEQHGLAGMLSRQADAVLDRVDGRVSSKWQARCVGVAIAADPRRRSGPLHAQTHPAERSGGCCRRR